MLSHWTRRNQCLHNVIATKKSTLLNSVAFRIKLQHGLWRRTIVRLNVSDQGFQVVHIYEILSKVWNLRQWTLTSMSTKSKWSWLKNKRLRTYYLKQARRQELSSKYHPLEQRHCGYFMQETKWVHIGAHLRDRHANLRSVSLNMLS